MMYYYGIIKRIMVKKGRKDKPPVGSLPTYIRFTKTQLDLMDCAVVAGKFLNRSEFARDAVKRLLSTANPATTAR
jgi:hypothetical protein